MQTPRRVRTAGNRACEHAGFSRCGVTVGSRSRDVGSMETVQGVRSVQTPLRGAGCCVTPGPGAGSGARRCRRLPRGPPGGAGAGCCPNTSPARVRPAARAALGVCAVGPRLLRADPPFRGATSRHGGGPEVCAPLPWPRRPRPCPRGSQHVPSGCQVFGGAGGSHPPLTRLDRAPEILRSHAPYFFVVKSKAPHWRPRSSRP